MNTPSSYDTSRTLLSGLRDPGDRSRYEASWTRFVEKYTPLIYRWCRGNGIASHTDAEYVTQDLMIKLVGCLKRFDYDDSRSFRSWLRTATRRVVIDFWQARNREQTESSFDFSQVASREDLAAKLNSEFDRELQEEAQSRARNQCSSRDWEIFTQLVGGTPVSAIEAEFKINVPTIYKVKSRVLGLIREHVRQLEMSGIA